MTLQGGRLDARFLAGALLDPLDLVAAPLGPAHVHSRQHFGPVLRFGAAGAGMDLDEAVVAVGFAGQQRLQFRAGGGFFQRRQRRFGLADNIFVAFGLPQLKQFDVVAKLPVEPVEPGDPRLQPGAFAHDRLGVVGALPEIGILSLDVQLGEAGKGGVVVKDASAAIAASRGSPS